MSNRIAQARGKAILIALVLGACTLPPAGAQSILLKSDETRIIDKFNWLPYAFFSQSFGLGLGVGGAYTGWPAEESSAMGAITLGTKGSYNVIGAMSDLRVPGPKRLYAEPLFMLGRYQEQYLYLGQDNPGFEGRRAGANDSDPDNYREATQWDNRVEIELSYLLPLGHARDDANIVNRYVLENGLLKSGAAGGEMWNPLTSGRTHLKLTPQWRQQTLDDDTIRVPLETINAELELKYNNFDFRFNPTYGSMQRIAYKRDFHQDEQLGEWARWDFEWAKVFSLGQSRSWKQRVIALDAWTSYVPTWETELVDGLETVTRRPPQYDSAVLGGIERMRAYEDARFHDKAAVYYSLELRGIPEWQPLRRNKLLEFADISYWQWVLFAEAGQVAPHWNLSGLHDDLHVDGGVSLRGMLHTAVCRLDFAFGEEGSRVIAMYGHPF